MTPVVAAEPGHVDAIAALLEELDTFYGETEIEPRDVRIRQINEALFGDPPLAHAVLAWDAQALVGLATYSFLWPAAGLTRSLYLKELYVAETARRRAVGKLLMDRLVEVATTNSCSRIEWITDRDNTPAQRFYEKLGVAQNGDKTFYRLEVSSSWRPMPGKGALLTAMAPEDGG
ncbi:GNAT family N-acetyltransferase [Micromonospora okii]|uniref:GNAT family N-acetyltransferase n=1 Tax=Micromonospora okii TaxID=1182970 RepID=UPI001E5D108A|nr:GNAT family N-acetyltransferase [Micromonospora okii]